MSDVKQEKNNNSFMEYNIDYIQISIIYNPSQLKKKKK